ncbi:AIM24 family protein [Streptomyces sp. SID4985]|nr:AIM24 family protein [Streptomyces sp. SID4985]
MPLGVRSGSFSTRGPCSLHPAGGYFRGVATFRLQGSKVLAVDMTGDAVKAKNGSMVAYDGQMAFKKLSGGGEGLRGMVTRRLTGEQMTVMEVRGQGTCWFADRASEINLVTLRGDKLWVESSNLLATDAGLRTGTAFTGLRGASQGNGLFTTTVEGNGQAALLSDGPAVVLRVSPQYPLTVDPGAYIAHQGDVRQSFQSGVTFRTLLGEGGGEAFQIRFEGDGLVYVQPSERNTIAGDL